MNIETTSFGNLSTDELSDILEQHEIIERLRAGEGDEVTLCNDSDEPGKPVSLVICEAEFTGFKEWRFAGGTLLEALREADQALAEFEGDEA